MNIFTNDDYRRIQAWLKANAIKDSDFVISEDTVPDKDILVITKNMSTVPINYKIKIKDLLNSSLGKAVIDKIIAKAVTINNVLTVDAANVKLNNEKGTTLQDVLNYFENNKLNRHTDDIFDGNLTIKKDLTIGGHIKSDDGLTTIEENFEATGEITDGNGNQLSEVNSAARGWTIEAINPQQDEPTVRAKYVLKDYNGVPKGNTIKIYKDSAITNVYLGTTEDTCNSDTGEVTKKPIKDSNEALSIVYRLDTGKYSLVNVPLGIFTREAEFDKYRGLGVTENGQVFIKLATDVESSNYLHFNSLGEISADGINNRILQDLGTLIHSVAGDGTMWGKYKANEGTKDSTDDNSRWAEFNKAEKNRDKQVSDEIDKIQKKVEDVNLDTIKQAQDNAVQAIADREAEILVKSDASEISSSAGGLEGSNVEEKLTSASGKLAELKNKTEDISKKVIETEEDYISIEDNNGNEVFHIDENGLDAKNLKSNGKEVLTEHQDISGLATKKEVENKQDKISQIAQNTTTSDEEEQSWESDDEREKYASIGSYGIKAKGFFDLKGNPIGTRNVKTHVIVCRRNGTVGVNCDFAGLNAIHEALESITDNSADNRYIIKVYGHFVFDRVRYYDGGSEITSSYWKAMNNINTNNTWWANVYGKDYVTIDGGDKDKTSIEVYLDENTDFPSYTNSSTKYNGTNYHVLFTNALETHFKNITFVGVNTRYCVHSESADENKGCLSVFENCNFVYDKTYTFSGYGASHLLGLGTRLNFNWEFKNCKFVNTALSAIIGGHSGYTTDMNFISKNVSAVIHFSCCDFNTSAEFISYECYVPYQDRIILEGCNIPKNACAVVKINYATRKPTSNIKPVKIFSDKPMTIRNAAKDGKVLKAESLQTGTILFKGTALDSIIYNDNYSGGVLGAENVTEFGAIKYYGQCYKSGNGAFSLGTRVFSSWGNGNDTLGKLLGDCSANPKTLVLDINGTEYTHTFNTDMSAVADDDIISALNATFDGVAVISIDYESDYVYPNADGVMLVKNTSEEEIIKGQGVILGRGTMSPALDNTPFIDGVCIDDTPNGSWGRIVTKGPIYNEFINQISGDIWGNGKVSENGFISTSNKAECHIYRRSDVFYIV